MLTVLIPAHNEEVSIVKTLRSLSSQTVQPDRVMVVADNCTDRTVEVSRREGAEVFETIGNVHKKAGALNQGIAHVATDFVMVLDADTAIAPTFIEEGLRLLADDPRLGAVGGVFRGDNPRGYLQQCQANEYVRYGVQIDVTQRTSVLTGTAAILRRSALESVASARGKTLPGTSGDFYDRDAITEDSEMTLALKHAGWNLASPVSMSCTTELMPTWGDLRRQRVRWYKGMLDNLRSYGFTRKTARYFGQQAMLTLGTVMMFVFLFLTAMSVAMGTFALVPFWVGIGLIFLAEKVFTAWGNGRKGRILAVFLLPELVYDIALQCAFVRALFLTALNRQTSWNHIIINNEGD